MWRISFLCCLTVCAQACGGSAARLPGPTGPPPMERPPAGGYMAVPEGCSEALVGVRTGPSSDESAAWLEAAGIDLSDPAFVQIDSVRMDLANRAELRPMMERELSAAGREAGVSASVFTAVALNVSSRGRVLEVRVARSSGHDVLDAAATRVAQEMVFNPLDLADCLVSVWAVIPIRFQVARTP